MSWWRAGLVLAALAVGLAGIALGLSDRRATASHDASAGSDLIPGRYIVMLREGADPDGYARLLGGRYGFAADRVYRYAARGFAAHLSDAAAAALRASPNVLSVEQDRFVYALDETLPTGIDRIDAEPGGPINDPGPDSDIDVAVIDTGVQSTHPDLNVVGGTASYYRVLCGRTDSFEDQNGHGTHVAGTIGARDDNAGVVGVAPGARIWAVRVLGADGSGCTSDVIAGVDWVTANAATIEVANMSLGGGNSSALCNAIAASVNAGVIYSVAAGNSNTNAADSSPANCADAVTVSAVADYNGQPGGGAAATCSNRGPDDSLANFSNFGAVVDIAAPGVCILSTWLNGGYQTISGTSMAAPHVAGAAALLRLGGYAGSAQGPAVVAAMTDAGKTVPQSDACGFSGDPDGFAEPMLYLVAGCVVPPPPTATPTAPPTATSTPAPPTATPTATSTPGPATLYFAVQDNGTAGGLSVANEDIVVWHGGSGFSLLFDGSDVGLSSLAIDAFAVNGANEILISFTAAGSVPGIGTVDDSDVVRFAPSSLGTSTAGSFTLFFDGSDVGLTNDDEDVDAIEVLPDGRLLISTSGSATVTGVSAADEDVLQFTSTSLGPTTLGTWALYFDGSDVGLGSSSSEDVDGLALGAAGTIYLSTTGSFSVTGIAGADEDVFVFTPSSLGSVTSGTYASTLFFDGSVHGLGNNDLFAIDLP